MILGMESISELISHEIPSYFYTNLELIDK